MPRKRTPRPRFCEYCGHPFGAERGPAAKTCSPECQRDRNNEREKARYQRVKDTEAWAQTREAYIETLKERAAADPEFAERLAEQHRQAVRRHVGKTPPTAQRQETKRLERRQWRERLHAEPMAWVAYKFKQRERHTHRPD